MGNKVLSHVRHIYGYPCRVRTSATVEAGKSGDWNLEVSVYESSNKKQGTTDEFYDASMDYWKLYGIDDETRDFLLRVLVKGAYIYLEGRLKTWKDKAGEYRKYPLLRLVAVRDEANKCWEVVYERFRNDDSEDAGSDMAQPSASSKRK